MSEDKLLRELVRVAKDDRVAKQDWNEAYHDARWDRLSAGTLTPEEDAALQALAEASEEARRAYEAFRPLDADFRARVVSAVEAQRANGAAVEKPPGKLLLFVRRHAQVGSLLAAAASLAAVFGLLLLRGPGAELPALPEYDLHLEGGVRTMRSEPPTGDENDSLFLPGNRFELVLRPRTAVSGPVTVRLFLERDGELHLWEVPAEVSASGAVRVAGEIGREIVIEPGEWILWTLLGRPETLPEADQLRVHLGEPSPGGHDWVLLRTTFRIGPK